MSKLLDHLKGLRHRAMAHGMPSLDEGEVLEEVKRRRGGATASEYIAEAEAETERLARIHRRIGYGVVAAFVVAFLSFVAWLAFK